MAKATLTARNVQTLEAKEGGRATYFDTEDPTGFVLRISGNTRALYVTYRLHGRFTWYRIGDVAKLTLTQARKEAKRVLAEVELGRDPQAARREKRAEAERDRLAETFLALCRDWLALRKPSLREKTITNYTWLIEEKVAGTPLGRIAAKKINAADVERVLTDVRDTSGGPTSNRLHSMLTTVCKWALRKDRISVNVLDAVDQPVKEQARERVLTDPELACLFAALKDEKPAVGAAVRTLLLLGQRATATIQGLRWDGLDLDADIPTWTIPGEFQKGGRLHVVPLPKQVVTMIEALRPASGSAERVLHGVDEQNHWRWWAPLRDKAIALAKEKGVKMEPFTRHDLRRTCATGITRLGVTRFIAQRVIGHAEGGVGGIYDRNDYLREKAAALASWAAHLVKVETGEKKGADVLPMRA